MACLKLSPEQEEEKKFVSLKHLIDDGRLRAGDKLTFVCEDGQWFGFMGTVERTGAISVEKHNTTDAEGWVINMERFTTSAGPEARARRGQAHRARAAAAWPMRAVKEYARRNWDTYFTLNNLPRKFNQPPWRHTYVCEPGSPNTRPRLIQQLLIMRNEVRAFPEAAAWQGPLDTRSRVNPLAPFLLSVPGQPARLIPEGYTPPKSTHASSEDEAHASSEDEAPAPRRRRGTEPELEPEPAVPMASTPSARAALARAVPSAGPWHACRRASAAGDDAGPSAKRQAVASGHAMLATVAALEEYAAAFFDGAAMFPGACDEAAGMHSACSQRSVRSDLPLHAAYACSTVHRYGT
eukprot:scaffold9.g3077.t1